MNNRPLYWAVMCFALGEVLYIIAGKVGDIGTAVAVLICVAFCILKLKLDRLKKCIYIMMLVLGLVRIWWAEYSFVGYALFGKGEYIQVEKEYEEYTVSYQQGKIQDGHKNNSYIESCVNLVGEGIVDNISTSEKGYNITLNLLDSQTEKVRISKAYKIIIYGVEQEYHIGTRVAINGEINDFVSSGNPGEFDRKNYYKARGIVAYGVGSGIDVVSLDNEKRVEGVEGVYYCVKHKLYGLREKLKETLYRICDKDGAALYAGILLGEKGDIPESDILLYRLIGIAHIFAISGLHISIVGGLLYKLLRKIGVRFFLSAVLAMTVTLLYGIMTGFSFSTIRAVVMLGLSLGGEVLGRKYDMLTGMGLALGVLLFASPFRILDGGLILSFAAVAGVVVAKHIIKLLEENKWFKQLQKKKNRWMYGIMSALIFSVGISLVTTPLIAFMYFQIPLYSVFINMLVVPLMSVTVFCGFFGMLLSVISPLLGSMVIYPGVLSLKLYEVVCRLVQKLPACVINTGKPKIIELIICYVMIVVTLVLINPRFVAWVRNAMHKKTRKWIPYRRLRCMCLVVMMAVLITGLVGIICVCISVHEERIVFLDVGQGDGILIHTNQGTNIAIDVGSTSNDSLGEYVAYPALLAEDMGHIDYWFISHIDRDHVSGLEYLLMQEVDMGISIDNLVVGGNNRYLEEAKLIDLAKDKGINVIYMEQGDYITDGSVFVTALHPPKASTDADKNEQSLVLSYRSENISILFTGDIGEEAIGSMLEQELLYGDFDVLKVPHHGSKYSYSMKFLEKLNHQVSIISCGWRNSYGHPHKEMLEGLTNVGSDIYRTDYQGAIRIRIKK